MADELAIARRPMTVLNAHGVHMRPSDRFVKLASSFQSEIRVECNGATANGKSILDMTCLAAECGAVLNVEARGPDAEAAVAALADLVAARFHMEEEEH